VAPPDASIRICHVVLSLRPGGLENGVVNVINGLPSPQFQSSVICLQESGEFAERIKDRSVEVVPMGLKPGNDPKMPFQVASVLRRLKPHIVHTRNIEAFFYGAVAAKIARVPHVIHSEHGRTFPETRLRSWVQRALVRGTDCTFAVTARLREDLVRYIGLPASRIEVLYNGVDLGKFSAARPPRAPDAPIRIGSVGRMVPVKNYPLLLEALAKLPADCRWTCRLVGDGPERDRLRTIALQLGLQDRVEFLGHREDVAALLQEMDIFVLPSISEGMSNTLLEAMAAGAAAIASDVGGNSEIVANGASGLLFPSGDAATLGEHLARLINDEGLRTRLCNAARERMHAEFSITGMIDRYASLYRRVAQGSR